MDTLEFYKWVEQAAKADRVEVIEAAIPMILSVASTEELSTMAVHVGYLADKRISDDALSAVFTRISPGEAGALRFISSRLKDHDRSRAHMDLFLTHLGEAAGACMLNCLYAGEYPLAKKILDLHPDEFPLQVSLSSGLHVKDYEVDCRGIDMEGFHGAEDIKRCFEMLANPDVVSLTKDGTHIALYWALDASKKSDALACLGKPFEGSLPELSGNRLSSPELALALNETREAQVHFPEIYGHFPAWVNDGDLADYQGIIAFKNEIRSTWGEKDPKIFTSLEAYGALRDEGFATRYGSTIIQGIRALESLEFRLGTNLKTWEHNLYHCYLEHFVTDHVLLGLEDRPGRTLALIPMEALKHMEIAPVDGVALGESMAFAHAFFPLDVLINREMKEKESSARVKQKKVFSAPGPIAFLDKMAASPHSEVLYSRVPFQMIEDALGFSKFYQNAQTLIDLQRRFGLKPPSDEKVVVELELEKLQALHDADYDLWLDDERVVRRNVRLKGGIDTPMPYLQLLKIGGYPHGHPEPTIEAALKSATKKAAAVFERAFLMYKGPVEVAQVARTPGEWSTFMVLFTQDEKAQALDLIPAKRREEFFAGDLGL